MAEPIKTVTFGGLTYNANDVQSTSTETDKKGNKTFIINFKTGETMKYPRQNYLGKLIEEYDMVKGHKKSYEYIINEQLYRTNSNDLQPKVEVKVKDGWIYDNTTFDISGVMGATFTTSKNTVAKVNLDNCYKCKVDLAANESSFYGDNAHIRGGNGNTVVLDSHDKASIHGKRIEGPGEADQKDYK